MKTSINCWSYLAQFFLEWEVFQPEVVENMKTHVLCFRNFFLENHAFLRWCRKIFRAGQATDNIAHARACCVPKATNTHSKNTYFDFPRQQWLHERASMLIVRTLPVLLLHSVVNALFRLRSLFLSLFICCFLLYFFLPFFLSRGRDSSVGTATGYGLDGPGIESRWGRDFSHTSRPALWLTQPPVQWVPGLSRR
jgi:hypothetical protein